MTRLLVSVRTLDEALLAAAAGVDLIDVKEPSRGPLGMADAEVRRAIGERLGQRHQLSAACGELRDFAHAPDLMRHIETRRVIEGDKTNGSTSDLDGPDAWNGYQFAKIGLAGCVADVLWRERWLAWRASLPSAVEPVLVCYADGHCCDALSYEDVRDLAMTAKVRMMLFDTFDKRGPGLCQIWQPADFLRIGQELRQAGISFVFAGKLELPNIAPLVDVGAAYLGLRGAVCDPTTSVDDRRNGKLNPAKIKNWQVALKIPTPATTHKPAES